MTEGINFHRSNIEREMCCAVMRGGFSAIPMTLLRGLATTFSDGGFSRNAGQIAYLERAAEFRIPNLIIGGSRDPQCPPEATLHTAALLSGVQDKQVLLVGKPYGQIDDYGHFDLLVGRNAQTEVWPHITRFLSRADSPSAAKDVMVAE
jgi:pimeloyl-ACP methyl ester carboxylesterase